jgi:ankyrin repeat protein
MGDRTSKDASRAEVDDQGRTPLHHEVMNGHVERVRVLIANGINVNAQDEIGRSALHYAAQAHDQESADVIMKAGATIDIQDEQGNTPLWIAVLYYRGECSFIKSLLKHGADPCQENIYRVSPLMLARRMSKSLAKCFKGYPKTS